MRLDKEEVKKQIVELVNSAGYKPMEISALASRFGVTPDKSKKFARMVREMAAEGQIVLLPGRRVAKPRRQKHLTARIVSIVKNGGFAALEDKSEVFISKQRLGGALPSDVVSVRLLKKTGRLPDAEVVKVLERNFTEFTGTFLKVGNHYYVLPDSGLKDRIRVLHHDAGAVQDHDKVLARIRHPDGKHEEPTATVITSYGSADSAAACCAAVLGRQHIRREFPPAVLAEAAALPQSAQADAGRLDLRDRPIFTIDGAHTKDIDDAVSVEKTEAGYRLGVHIADVSHYVKPGSELDREAYVRGTSIYYADSVIPMLPVALSNGICSLNPQEDRLAFSVLMNIDADGRVLDYQIRKSVIRSRVKGVYEELNVIFAKGPDDRLREKYREVLPEFAVMRELASVLSQARKKRGALDFDSDDSEILVDEDGIAADVRRRERGEAEQMIEEFMLMANEAVATFASGLKMPFVYRVHERPDDQKLEELALALRAAGIDARAVRPGMRPLDMARVLEKAADSPRSRALNDLILRSLAKARYSPECLGHFGLALKYYSHFTSPIRRYPDLAVHRILGDIIRDGAGDAVAGRYRAFVEDASKQSSEREVAAMQVEWDCDEIYKAEYMSRHIGETFDGIVTTVKNFGMYVALENTVEGLVRVEKLPGGWYDYDEAAMVLSCARTGVRYTIGDRVRVIVAGAEVATGQVDFELI